MKNASRMARYMMMQQSREGGGNRGGEGTRNEYRGGEGTRNEYRGGEGMKSEYSGRNRGGTRNEYGGGMENAYSRVEDGYETENRFRDRRGREHYDNGRYAPKNAYTPEYRGENDMENRQGQRRGRDGRYRAEGGGMRNEMRAEYDDDEEDDKGGRMNMIGFGRRDFPEPVWEAAEAQYGAKVEHNEMREMERRGGQRMNGGAMGEDMEFTPELAEKWAKSMKNSDNTSGAHWNMEQTRQLAQQRGVTADPAEFYAVVNAMYSDYCEVAKKHNVHNTDFYVDLAKAWLHD